MSSGTTQIDQLPTNPNPQAPPAQPVAQPQPQPETNSNNENIKIQNFLREALLRGFSFASLSHI